MLATDEGLKFAPPHKLVKALGPSYVTELVIPWGEYRKGGGKSGAPPYTTITAQRFEFFLNQLRSDPVLDVALAQVRCAQSPGLVRARVCGWGLPHSPPPHHSATRWAPAATAAPPPLPTRPRAPTTPCSA